jgi:hypothetical protein
MTGLSKEQLEMLKPGSTRRPAIPEGMFAPMLSAEDAKIRASSATTTAAARKALQ